MKYKDQTTFMDEAVDDITGWYYYNDGIEWAHLKECWSQSKLKYFNFVKNYNVVVTAGGHVGLYAKFYSKLFKTVYVFEPDPVSFYCLVNNIQEDNVIKMQCAVGDGKTLLELIPIHSPMSRQVTKSKNAIIPSIAIDNIPLSHCDLIQLDVENHEIYALYGAEKTIEKFRPVVILENGETNEILDFMNSKNYEIVDKESADVIWGPK